ncbi:hypothetical protein [Streptosporangium sp. 'caverna']|uniref:hypothetical protein n=1 Tax=Streptosporangium sp. 'caverna' TaxID=2202249 RepID=UPI000D7D9F9D|nr:hypothetical protein [Streptosporangium sp. 'caverna']AWS46170.1 hypothetical protein DKM19_37625 [Streptosporangium sp. 'caverna']
MASNVTRLYQAVLRDPSVPISIPLCRTFSDWIVGKGFPPADAGGPRVETEVDGARLTMERHGDCGRYTLEEPRGEGHLCTRVTYAESVPGMTGWVVVTVDRHGEGEAMVANAPGFLPAYLRTARITDGGVHVEDGPVALDEDDVQRFVHTMTEPRRRVPIVVVSVDPQNPGAGRARADYLAGAAAGASLVVQLTDQRAQDRFNKAMGSELGVFGGGIRTYVTPFDAGDERYPYRHPPMGGAMIRDQGIAALNRVVDGVIGETARRKLPDDVQQTLRIVYRVLAGRAEPSEIATAVAPRPAKSALTREELRRRMAAMIQRPAPSVIGAVIEKPVATKGSVGVEAGAAVTNGAITAEAGPAAANGAVAVGTETATANGVTAVEAAANGVITAEAGPAVANGAVAVEAAANGAATAGTGPDAGEGAVAVKSAPAAVPAPDLEELARTVANRVIRELRGELETALGLATSSGTTGGDSGRLLREIRMLGAHLSGLRDVVTERRRDELLVQAEDESDRLATEVESLRDEHRLLQEEYAEAVTSTRKLSERVRWLERTLAEAGQPVYGVTGEQPVFEPANLTEALLEARENLHHIVVGDTDGVAARLDLDHPAQCRTWAAKAWDALRALDDFAKARSRGEFAGGFYDWCAHGSPGRFTIPTGMLSMRESKTVASRHKFSAPRTFAVPPEVNPIGQVLMEAHIKLRPIGYPAPRMYFHDDSGGATGKIWIGYLGDHLPNTRTN